MLIFKENVKLIVATIIESLWKDKTHSERIKETIQSAYDQIYKGEFEQIDELEEEQQYPSKTESQRNTFVLSADQQERALIKSYGCEIENSKDRSDAGNGSDNGFRSLEFLADKLEEGGSLVNCGRGFPDKRKSSETSSQLLGLDQRSTDERSFQKNLLPHSSPELIGELRNGEHCRNGMCSGLMHHSKGQIVFKDAKENSFWPNSKKIQDLGCFIAQPVARIKQTLEIVSRSYDKNSIRYAKTSLRKEDFKTDKVNQKSVKRSAFQTSSQKSNQYMRNQFFSTAESQFRKKNKSMRLKEELFEIKWFDSYVNPNKGPSLSLSIQRPSSKNRSPVLFKSKENAVSALSSKKTETKADNRVFTCGDKQTPSIIRNVLFGSRTVV